MPEIPNRPEYQSDLFKKGLEVRRAVLGADYVDGSIARADDFNAALKSSARLMEPSTYSVPSTSRRTSRPFLNRSLWYSGRLGIAIALLLRL